MPQAFLVASKIQERLGLLKAGHLVDENAMLSELTELNPYIMYLLSQKLCNIKLCSFSDSSHGIMVEIRGQIRIVTGPRVNDNMPQGSMFHEITLTSHKQRRVSYSWIGSEILSAADDDDRDYGLKLSLESLFPRKPMKHELQTGSKALFGTLTTLHQAGDYRLRKSVPRMRDSLEV